MDVLVLSYKRIPKTELYDAAIVKWPDLEVLDDASSQPIEDILRTIHGQLLQHRTWLLGFKKQRVEAELVGDNLSTAFILDKENTNACADDSNVLLKMFAPMRVVIDWNDQDKGRE